MAKPRSAQTLTRPEQRIALRVATQAALTALPANSDSRTNGAITVVDDFSLWFFDLDSTAAASATVLVPDSGSGRWHNLIPAGGGAGGTSYKAPVRLATAAALAAYTRVGNVITANAVGALGNVDGVAVVAGDRLLLTSDGTASDVDNGIYVATSIGGGAAEYVLTRADDANADGEIVGGMLVAVQAGTAYGAEFFACTNAAAITINTTAITFVQVPNYADLASTANGEGASLIGVEDPDGVLVGTEAEAALEELAKRQLPGAANAAAVTAITAAQRTDGALVVKLDDPSLWIFDAGSAAAASDWVLVPDAGAGRWLNAAYLDGGLILPPAADNAALIALTAVDRQDGSLIVQLDTMQVWKYDLGSAAAASDWVVVPTDGTGRWLDVAHPNGGLVLPPVADNAALVALTAVDRQDGSIVVQLDTMQAWRYDLGSVAGADAWTVVPTDGVGRWVRTDVSVADAAGVTATTGGELVGLYDPTGLVTATTVGGGVRENAAIADEHRPGVPEINRLIMLGAPGAIVNGDTVTIGADVYEFRSSTPPAGGTPGRIWVYQGVDSAASRANFIDAINGVIDANRITYDGAVTETMLATAGTLLGTVDVQSADAAGGTIAPSGAATACSETLTTVTDIWDAPAMYAGVDQGGSAAQMATVTLSAAMILQGTLEIELDFTPASCILVNRSRPQTEAYTVTGNRVVLTLGGGGAPANQAGDVIDVLAQG